MLSEDQKGLHNMANFNELLKSNCYKRQSKLLSLDESFYPRKASKFVFWLKLPRSSSWILGVGQKGENGKGRERERENGSGKFGPSNENSCTCI